MKFEFGGPCGDRTHDLRIKRQRLRQDARSNIRFIISVNLQVIRMAHLEAIHDVEATVVRLLEKYGEDAALCVLPQGPRTVPYLQ